MHIRPIHDIVRCASHMSFSRGTLESHVDRISYGSTESLKTMQLCRHSGDILYQPCASFSTTFIISETSGICPTRTQQSLVNMQVRWISDLSSEAIRVSGALHGQRESLSLSMTWLRDLWRQLKIWDRKQPCSLVWVRMHCNVRLVLYTGWCIRIYVAIVMVGRQLNLWRKPNSL
jgi:hypothetical protein